MPVFPIGGFIGSFGVIKDLINILDNASDARADYQELVAELRGLERGLMAIKELNIDEGHHPQFLAVTQAVAGCHQCINNFLVKVTKFQSLGKSTTPKNSTWKFRRFSTDLRKVQWALSKDDVTKFREEVQLHVLSIQMLLLTLRMYEGTFCGYQSELLAWDSKQDSQSGIHQAAITALSDKLDQNTAMLQTQSELLKSVQTSLTKTLNTKQKQFFRAVINSITQFRSSLEWIPPQVIFQRPVEFLDACGRLAPFHLEFINSSEAFLAILKVRFKHAGLRKIEKQEFTLQETGSKRQLDLSAPWDSVFLPGQKVDMSMVFWRETFPRGGCPSCGFVSEERQGEDMEWLANVLSYKIN
ncbi:hypothetical protein GP486_005062 [Trichoglossum hirsutum]|uniref:Ubiquitin-like domain-containing protein n=1 Tax=Trichoglossum hirsutum TaxID=265104 RepID=A0A9P8L9T8_9PEZI|nr:hypothetical protein GP486_005062 [Trichoglossum hirsutum]